MVQNTRRRMMNHRMRISLNQRAKRNQRLNRTVKPFLRIRHRLDPQIENPPHRRVKRLKSQTTTYRMDHQIETLSGIILRKGQTMQTKHKQQQYWSIQ